MRKGVKGLTKKFNKIAAKLRALQADDFDALVEAGAALQEARRDIPEEMPGLSDLLNLCSDGIKGLSQSTGHDFNSLAEAMANAPAAAEKFLLSKDGPERELLINDLVVPGVALVAPGNHHMVLQRSGPQYLVRIKDGPAVHYQRPSVDVLFHSVARSAGKNAIGVLLTGMGADGAKGMLAMKDSGAYTLAQDEQSCIVFGMPKEAIKLAAVDEIVPLSNIAQTIIISRSKHSPDAS